MSDGIKRQLDRLIEDTILISQQQEQPLTIEFDPQWRSACYLQEAAEGELVSWQPVRQQGECNFSQLEKALDLELNPQFCDYFTRYFSNNLLAQAPEGYCELLQVWNGDDFERLQENLIGHVLMKRRLKQPVTLFFALTDEEDFMLSVENHSGNVVLEPVGKPASRVIAPSLSAFIASLKAVEQTRN
ncbi:SecY-interacting protein [Alteromonas sp. ASW11-130]|uniref:SecY-interacting protein n=1 Tax=Alteromonas sp. ASW11-130 TaxID=3015775 RepID=UPI002242BBDB|nr:SecY-interacting protein [Alteromonas sp. ASW11-130]MCW8091682.1 SecY-interacting protein [Alteromonas sp. ASW11-130]